MHFPLSFLSPKEKPKLATTPTRCTQNMELQLYSGNRNSQTMTTFVENDDTDDVPGGEIEFTDCEREQLKARREAFRDVYGTSGNVDVFQVGETIPPLARQQLNEALTMMPTSQRSQYDKALKHCPYLVEKESNPERFLKACRYDPWMTSQRICLYWKTRYEIFGERAFLPMLDLSGKGAVPQEIVTAMKCGGTTVLPPDRMNRSILYIDRSRFSNRCIDKDAQLIVTFYNLQVLFASDLALQHGFVLLTVMHDEDDKNNNNSNRTGDHTCGQENKHKNMPRQKVLQLFASVAIPLTMRAFHILVPKRRSLLESCLPLWLRLLEQHKSMSLRTVCHFAESPQDALTSLKQYGLLKESLPRKLGGNLDFETYLQHYQTASMPNHTSDQSCSAVPAAPPVVAQQKREGDEDDVTKARTSGALLESLAVVADQVRTKEARARKRKLDAIYQRKKRQRRKAEFTQIATEVEALKRVNSALRKEQCFLETLVQRAVKFVKTCDQNSSLQRHHEQPQGENNTKEKRGANGIPMATHQSASTTTQTSTTAVAGVEVPETTDQRPEKIAKLLITQINGDHGNVVAGVGAACFNNAPNGGFLAPVMINLEQMVSRQQTYQSDPLQLQQQLALLERMKGPMSSTSETNPLQGQQQQLMQLMLLEREQAVRQIQQQLTAQQQWLLQQQL